MWLSGVLRPGDTHWGFSEASAIYFQEAGIPNALVPLGAQGLPASSPIMVVPAAVVPVPSIGGGLLPGAWEGRVLVTIDALDPVY